MREDQRNTLIRYGDRFVLKVFRRVEQGVNPEVEVGTFLTDRGAPFVPAVAGSLEYRRDGVAMSLGVLNAFVPNQSDGWRHARDVLGRFFEAALTSSDVPPQPPRPPSDEPMPERVLELMGEYPDAVRLLGTRLAELHATLASGTSDPAFAPDPFTDHYRQGLYHGLIGGAGRAFATLRNGLDRLSEEALDEAGKVLARMDEVRAVYRPIRDERFYAQRIRIHGDLNLRQVLWTGKDWTFIDFEGQPSRAYGERQLKRTPLLDVAALMRSLQYAAFAVRFGRVPGVTPTAETASAYDRWAEFW
jgi:maltose alpha-D-glucosyltransferase/alpha-amylase